MSYPRLENNVFWQNRSYYVGVGALSNAYQQNIVTLYNSFTSTPAPSQPQADATATNSNGGVQITGGTGACTPASYWDIGVRGDTGPTNHSSGFTLAPTYSLLTNVSGYSGTSPNPHNLAADPSVISQYCNGSRTPPELMSAGWQVPPGIADATVPNPPFTLQASATVDEGNNWVNMSWGPLAVTHPLTGAVLGNYGPATAASPVVNYIPSTAATNFNDAPAFDFYNNARKTNSAVDAGAVEFGGAVVAPTLTSIAPSSGRRSSVVAVTLTGTNLTGTLAVNVSGNGITVSGITVVNDTTVTATFTISSTAFLTTRNVTVTTPGGTSGPVSFTVAAATLSSIAPNSGVRGTAVNVTLTGTGLTGATSVNVGGAPGNGITVSNFAAVNDTTVTATFTITAGAPIATRNVTVTTPGGTTNAVQFSVVGPALTSVAPNAASRGQAVPITLTGTHLTGTTSVNVGGGAGNGIAVSAVTVVNDTTVTATLTISATAPAVTRNITVTTTPGGTSNAVTFTVQAPVLISVSPNAAVRGQAVPITLTGTRLTGTITVNVGGGPGNGITVSGVTVVNDTTVTATLTISATAPAAARTITVTTAPGGNSNGVTFTVQAPTLASIAPSSGTHGTTVPVSFTGTRLTGATGLTISGNGGANPITVTGFSAVSDTSVTANFVIPAGAALTTRNVAVITSSSGNSNAVAFTVN